MTNGKRKPIHVLNAAEFEILLGETKTNVTFAKDPDWIPGDAHAWIASVRLEGSEPVVIKSADHPYALRPNVSHALELAELNAIGHPPAPETRPPQCEPTIPEQDVAKALEGSKAHLERKLKPKPAGMTTKNTGLG